MSQTLNPYQAPTAEIISTRQDSAAEQIRNQHLKHEASLKSFGILFYLGGFFTLLAGISVIFAGQLTAEQSGALLFGALIALLGMASLFAGRGLRTLNAKMKILITLVAVFGLLNFPIGTILNAYLLYLVYSKKGAMIFSSQYQDVIAATPHIKYKTSIIVWLVLGLMVLGIVAAILIPQFAG